MQGSFGDQHRCFVASWLINRYNYHMKIFTGKFNVASFLIGCILVCQSAIPTKAAVSLTGKLETLWGTGRGPQAAQLSRSWLVRPGQERVELFFAGGQEEAVPQEWIDQQVEVTGNYQSLSDGTTGLMVETIELFTEVGVLSISSTFTGTTPWVTLLCKFKDIPNEPKPAGYFSDMYGDGFPRLVSYWKEVSYNLIDVSNSTATPAWYVLPQNQGYYLYDRNGDGEVDLDFDRLNEDCIGLADPTIDFRSYKGIQFIVNADLGGASWGGYQTFNIDGELRVWMATWLPDWGYKDLSIIEHEMGHGYGMKHSTAPNGKLYGNQWDVMSDASSNCANSYDPTFACLGQHPIAFTKDQVGWLAADRKVTVNLGEMQTVIIGKLANPAVSGVLLAIIPINGAVDKYYSVEVRKKAGYDVKLPGEGVILHKVDKTRQVMAEFIDFDNNNNTGDEAAIWIPGESWEDTGQWIWMSVRSAVGDGYEVILSNASGNTIPPFPQPDRDKLLYLPLMQNSRDS